MGLTAAEIIEHPAFKQNVIWDLKPNEKAKISVAKGRGGPFNLMYEMHGNGPIRILVSTRRRVITVMSCMLSQSKEYLVDYGAWSLKMVLAASDTRLRPRSKFEVFMSHLR